MCDDTQTHRDANTFYIGVEMFVFHWSKQISAEDITSSYKLSG